MNKRILMYLVFLFSFSELAAQEKLSRFAIGFNYGFGSEFSNTDYTFTNHFYKLQLYYNLKEGKHFQYQILIQPEINFAKHQLLNFYFVKPDSPYFEEKRERYTKLKDVKEYVLNIGFLVRKPLSERCSFYILGSIGPMINDTETERMSEGFAFADVLAVGFSFKFKKMQFDIRQEVRHVSNGGLSDTNAGYNTKNFDFGFLYPL